METTVQIVCDPSQREAICFIVKTAQEENTILLGRVDVFYQDLSFAYHNIYIAGPHELCKSIIADLIDDDYKIFYGLPDPG